MNKKIHFLLTHFCDYNLDYERFFYDNLNILHNSGIVYPWLDGKTHNFSWQYHLAENMRSLKENDQKKHAELAEFLEKGDSLLFVIPNLYELHIPFFLDLLRKNPLFAEWSDAVTSLVWLACDKGKELEYGCFFNFPKDWADRLYQSWSNNHDKWVKNIADALECVDKVQIIKDCGENHVPISRIIKALDLDIPLEKCVPLKETRQISPEALLAIHTVRTLLPEITLDQALDVMLKVDNGKFSYVEPRKLRELHDLYAQDLVNFGCKYGVDLSFTAPEIQKDWRPPERISTKYVKLCHEKLLGEMPASEREYSIRNLEYRPDANEFFSKPQDYVNELREKFSIRMVEPVVSVLTLACNQEKYIAECIESVLEQKTDFPVRHIIVDDNSRDDTPKIIESYARKYPSISPVIFHGPRPVGGNVIALFSHCKSQYAALCDGDDYFTDPLKLQKQYEYLENNPDCSICFHTTAIEYEDGSETLYYPPIDKLPQRKNGKFYLSDLINVNFIQTNSVMYRWRFGNGLPEWFDASLVPADWYWHLLHAENGRIGFLPEVMSVYRRHANSLFKEAFKESSEHRRIHGLSELNTLDVINKHFNGRYFKQLSLYAIGILTDFLKISMKEKNFSLMDETYKKFPEFSNDFFSNMKIIPGSNKKK